MTQSLVLNATYEPLCVVPSRRALMLILADKAEMLHATEQVFRAERLALAEPSVVRLCYFVKVPYQARVALNRRAVFAPRRSSLPVLRSFGRKHRSRDPSQQRGFSRLGKRRGVLPALQRT